MKISTVLYIYIFELFFAEFQRGFESVARFMDFVVEIFELGFGICGKII